MSDSLDSMIIGVDGGGTRCRVALCLGDAQFDAVEGAANVATDFDAAIATIKRGLAAAAAQSGRRFEDLLVARAHIGLAGVMRPADGDAVAAALGMARAVVVDDQPGAVVGALGHSDGAVAAIGTGSFVARQSGGAVTALGGWGLVLGDEASGAWLGRGMLAATLRAEDGLIPRTDATAAVMAEFGGETAAIVAYGARTGPGGFAARAPDVADAADAGDAAAAALMRAGADYIHQALLALGWTPAERLCLIGGVGPRYAPYLPEVAADALAPPLGDALDGALALAARGGAGG